ncbi:hypothetical protein COHA_009452 [Chlorella ohadii]|uniref:S1 motif domain-containing protein n=1 Tax=Chlorella ohadii TaxID=2649997 RepID=A0AAD5GXU3_9CHLO|nr:hypothetical protein COHA_009452 [Chlorella ohadii]
MAQLVSLGRAPVAPTAVAARAAAARQPALAAVQHAAAVRHPQQRRSLQPCRAANAEAEAQAAPAAEGAEPVKPKLMSEAWESVIQMKQEGTIVETVVKAANKSGLNLKIGKLQAFLPYKLLDPARLENFRNADGSRTMPAGGHKQLVGTKLRVRVTQVIVPEKRLIVSEKAVLLDELANMLQPGDVIEGVVGAIMDWGCFVECRTVNGRPCPRAEAVLPLRELSYAWVATASELLKPGQAVRVSVLFRQTDPQAKVVVSLKRMEDDPLKETLDNVLPLNGASYEQLEEVPASVPQGVDEILEALAQQPGVEGVTLGRSVEEKRTVSQDLELWITKEQLDDGFNLAVRAGRRVQEVHVVTKMSPADMRAAVQRVLRSIA